MSVRRRLLLLAQSSGWDGRGGKGRGGAEHVEHRPDGVVGRDWVAELRVCGIRGRVELGLSCRVGFAAANTGVG